MTRTANTCTVGSGLLLLCGLLDSVRFAVIQIELPGSEPRLTFNEETTCRIKKLYVELRTIPPCVSSAATCQPASQLPCCLLAADDGRYPCMWLLCWIAFLTCKVFLCRLGACKRLWELHRELGSYEPAWMLPGGWEA